MPRKRKNQVSLQTFSEDPGALLYNDYSSNAELLSFGTEGERLKAGALKIQGQNVYRSLRFTNIIFTDNVELNLSTFHGSVAFINCRFEKHLTAVASRFKGSLYIKECKFPLLRPAEPPGGGLPDPQRSEPRNPYSRLDLHTAQIGNLLDLSGTSVAGDIGLERVIIGNSLRIRCRRHPDRYSTIRGNVYAQDLVVGNLCDLSHLRVKRSRIDPHAGGNLLLDRARITSSLTISAAKRSRRQIIDGDDATPFAPLNAPENPGAKDPAHDSAVPADELTVNKASIPNKTELSESIASTQIENSDSKPDASTDEPGALDVPNAHDHAVLEFPRTPIPSRIEGIVSLTGAHIGESLDLRGTLIGDDVPIRCVLDLANTSIGQNLHLEPDTFNNHFTECRGDINLDGSTIGGNVYFDDCWILGGILASGLDVKGNFSIEASPRPCQVVPHVGSILTAKDFKASLWAPYTKIGGSLVMSGTQFGSAVNFARATIGNNWYMTSPEGQEPCRVNAGNLSLNLDKGYSPFTRTEGAEFQTEAVSLYCTEAKVTGSLYWTHFEAIDAPVIAEGLTCFQFKLTTNSNFRNIADFTGCVIENDFDARESHFDRGLMLTSSTVSGNLLAQNATFGMIWSENLANENHPVNERSKDFNAGENNFSKMVEWAECLLDLPKPSLSLVNATVLGFVDLKGAKFEGPINADYADCSASIILDSLDRDHQTTIGVGYHPGGFFYSLSLTGTSVKGGVYGRSVKFKGAIDVTMAQISGDFNLSTHIKGMRTNVGKSVCHNSAGTVELGLWLRDSAIGGQLQLKGVDITAGLFLVDSRIQGTAELHDATIGSSKHRAGREFSLDARSCTIQGPLRASGATFSSHVLIKDSDIAGIQIRSHPANSKRVALIGGDLIGTHTTIDGPVELSGLVIVGGIDLRYCTIHGTFDMQAIPGLSGPTEPPEGHPDFSSNESRLGPFTDYTRSTGDPMLVPIWRTSCGCLTDWDHVSLMMQGSKIHGSLYLRGTFFRGGLNLRSIHVMGIVALDAFTELKCEIGPPVEIPTFIGRGKYRKREFSLRLSNSVIDSHIEATNLNCVAGISLTNATVNADVRFQRVRCGEGYWLINRNHHASMLLDQLEAGGDIVIEFSSIASSGVSARGIRPSKDLTIRFRSDSGAFLAEGQLPCPTYFREFLESNERLQRETLGLNAGSAAASCFCLDLERSTIPGELAIDIYEKSKSWMNLNQVRVGQLTGHWLRFAENPAPPTNQAIGYPFSVDLFDFDEIQFLNRPEVKQKLGPDWTKTGIGVGIIFFLIFLWMALTAPDRIWTVAPVSLILAVYTLVRYEAYRRNDDVSIDIYRTKLDAASILAEKSSFSEKFYVKLVEYFASRGHRDLADVMFREMKRRELEIDPTFVGPVATWVIKETTHPGRIVASALLALQIGICTEGMYADRTSPWSSGPTSEPAAVSVKWESPPAKVSLTPAPLKPITPAQTDKQKPAKGILKDPKALAPSPMVITVEPPTAHVAVTMPQGDSHRPVPITPSVVDVYVAPLKHMIPFAKLDELREVDANLPLKLTPGTNVPFLRMGHVYMLLSLFGYAGFSVLVLSIAGLFRRHRYRGAVE